MPMRQGARSATAPGGQESNGRSILLVEDNEDVAQFYGREFERKGCRIRVAVNGREALEYLKEAQPDAVLLDLWMPELDGFGVLAAMRSTPKLNGIPVMVLSARGDPDEIERALALGARDYLVKAAITPDKVVEKVEALIREPGRPMTLIRYRLNVHHDCGDAIRLGATFFGATGLSCPDCGALYQLELTPDFSHNSPTFTARFLCPDCPTPKATAERKQDGAHRGH